MAAQEPLSLAEMQAQLRQRLEYLEEQIEPLLREANEIRSLLGAKPSPSGSTKADDTKAALLAAVAESPGRAGADYAAAVGVTGQTALRHLNALAEAGQITREGQARSTRWHPA